LRRRLLRSLLSLSVLLLAPMGGAVAADPAGLDIDAVMRSFGFTDDEIARVRAGEVVSRASANLETQANEISAVVAMVTRVPLAEAVEYGRQAEDLLLSPTILENVRFAGDASQPDIDGAFAIVKLGDSDRAEVKRLLAVEPGGEFNLSDAEIERFRTAMLDTPRDGATAVSAVYRQILLERYRAFRESGLDGIAPYQRKDGTASAGDELMAVLDTFGIIGESFPEVIRALRDYPEGAEPYEEWFYVAKEKIGKRVAFVLGHELADITDDHALFTERQYYVGHSYNSLSVASWLVPFEGGTFVLYGNATFTDQVTGALTTLKRKIGRGQVQKQLRDYFEKIRADVEAGD